MKPILVPPNKKTGLVNGLNNYKKAKQRVSIFYNELNNLLKFPKTKKRYNQLIVTFLLEVVWVDIKFLYIIIHKEISCVNPKVRK